jgi:hypothetical protein
MPPPLMEVGAFSSVTSCGWDSLGRWSPVFGWGRSIVEAPSSGAFDGDVERHREGAAFGRGSPDSATTSSALVRLGRSVSFFGRARGDTAARSSCEATHGDMGRRGAVDLLRGDVCTARLREGQRGPLGRGPGLRTSGGPQSSPAATAFAATRSRRQERSLGSARGRLTADETQQRTPCRDTVDPSGTAAATLPSGTTPPDRTTRRGPHGDVGAQCGAQSPRGPAAKRSAMTR